MASTKKEKLARREEATRLSSAIDMKRGYIHYLRNRVLDSRPIITEIGRHREHADRHIKEADRLEAVIADLPAALAKADSELKELLSQQPAKAAKIVKLKLQAADIQAALAELLKEATDNA